MSPPRGRTRSPRPGGDFLAAVRKPAGPTSRRMVDLLSRRLGRRDLGHAGTLDPFASGLLLVLAGRATRLVPWIHEWDKEYVARIRLGVATDTLDGTGRVISEVPLREIPETEIQRAAASLVGSVEQAPPMYSAARSGGVRLYELARKGIEVERAVRIRMVHRFTIEEIALPDVLARVTVSSGTYIRTLAEAFGRVLQVPAHLKELDRTRIGPVTLSGALPGDRIDDLAVEEVLAAAVPLPDILSDWPVVRVDAAEAVGIRHGRLGPATTSAGPADRFRVLSPDGKLLALIGRSEERGEFSFLRVFAGGEAS